MNIVDALAQKIEHTQLKPMATAKDIETLCKEALEWGFYGVCIPSCWIKYATSFLDQSSVKIISVAGFPLGSNDTFLKCKEVEFGLSQGAHEIDFVINIGWLKENRLLALQNEFDQLVNIAHKFPLKAILETCYLNEEEKKIASQLAIESGIAYVKTSTGFAPTGATVADLRLIKNIAPLVKASGGIKTLDLALKMLEAGADRLGTSASVAIMQELYNHKEASTVVH